MDKSLGFLFSMIIIYVLMAVSWFSNVNQYNELRQQMNNIEGSSIEALQNQIDEHYKDKEFK